MTNVTDLESLAEAVRDHDGAPPFNDQALIEARRGERSILAGEGGLALVSGSEAELAVWPNLRGLGHGRDLVALVTDHFGDRAWSAWAHGDHPAAAKLASEFGLQRTRELLQLRAAVPDGATLPDAVRPFTEDDAGAWLKVNGEAFATHPEQGSLTASDLADRRGAEWHSDANLLLHETDGTLDAFTWLKPQGNGVVELYAIGVSPSAQGRGLGRLMMDATFGRMRELGAETAHLYVEGDNEPALELYKRFGFMRWAIDVQYSKQ